MEIELFDGKTYPRELLEKQAPKLLRYTLEHGATFSENVFLKDICPSWGRFLLALSVCVGAEMVFVFGLLEGTKIISLWCDILIAVLAFLYLAMAGSFLLKCLLFYDRKYPLRTVRIEKNVLTLSEQGSCETFGNFGAFELKKVALPNGDALFSLPRFQACFMINVRYGKFIVLGLSPETYEILAEYKALLTPRTPAGT